MGVLRGWTGAGDAGTLKAGVGVEFQWDDRAQVIDRNNVSVKADDLSGDLALRQIVVGVQTGRGAIIGSA